MSKLPPELLKELQDDYLNSLPEILKDLRNSVQLKKWDVVQNQFHRFAGNGKTYGLSEVSELGRAIENYLQRNPNPQLPLIEQSVELFESIIDAYRAGAKPHPAAINEVVKKLAS